MDSPQLFKAFGLACVLGMLIGIEREYAQKEDSTFAGVRTFGLISLLGATAALLSRQVAPLVLPLAFFSFAVLVAVTYWISTRDEVGYGVTTEVASLVAFLLGALVVYDFPELAAAVAITATALLAAKEALHRLADRIEQSDIVATLKFAIVTFIILPLLPDKAYGPFDAFNPHKTWFMVILISGIGFAGYVLVKTLGAKKGIGIAAALGGLVSSTAVTVTFSKKSKDQEGLSAYFAMAVVLASSIMFVRVLIEIAAVNRALLPKAVIPLVSMAVCAVAYCLFLYLRANREDSESPKFTNPFELGGAVKFGLVYAVIILLVKAAEHYVGAAGIYLVSLVSGLTDVDAITLSVCEAAKGEGLPVVVGVRAITLAVIANTCVKGSLALSMGSRLLGKRVATGFGLAFAVGVVALFFVR